MKKKNWAAICLISVSFLMVSSTVHANLIVNGDFEAGDFTGWNNVGTVAVGSDIQFQTFAGAIGTFTIGSYAVAFGGGNLPATGILSQDFFTTPGYEYELSFSYGRYGDGSGGPQSVQIEAINIADDKHLLDTVITDTSGERNLALVFNNYNFRFVADDLQTRLSFSDVSAGTISTDGLLDNVTITAIPAPVPEPATMLLFGTGLAGLVGTRIRRKKE